MFCHLAFHSQKKEREREKFVSTRRQRDLKKRMDETEIILLAETRKERCKEFHNEKHTRSMHESKSRPIVPNTPNPPHD